MGEVCPGERALLVLFAVGLVLFLFTFLVNLMAAVVVFRQTKRAERLLS
jgi:ABC-type phosphate transport system permease subunit